jgi:ribonucleotide monophosphatase NagD (HAD superfamily)
MAKKGSKSQRGKAETRWGETKSEQIAVSVTPTGKRLFMEKIRSIGMSIAEFIERVGRGKIKLVIVTDSLQELIDAYGLENLANDAVISVESLTEIRDGRTPTPVECLGLSRALNLTPEQLQEALNHQP